MGEALTHEDTHEIVDKLVALYTQKRQLLSRATASLLLFSLRRESDHGSYLDVTFVFRAGMAGVLRIWWEEGDLTLNYPLEVREDVEDA